MTVKAPGFIVTQGKIALLLSLITLGGVFYQGASALLDTKYRIASLEEKWQRTEQSQREMTSVVGKLSEAINELNITLREVQVRQDGKEVSKR